MNGGEGVNLKKIALSAVILTFLVCSIFGCAPGKIYLVDLKYISQDTAEKVPQPEHPLTIGIKTFDDSRMEKEDVGRRIRSGGRMDIFKANLPPVDQAVTRAIKNYLTKRGYRLVDIQSWDFSPEGLSDAPDGVDIMIGGKIESLWAEVESSITRTKIKSRVKLLVYVGKVNEGKVITRKVESLPEVTEISFKREKVERSLNQTISEVIERTLDDLE